MASIIGNAVVIIALAIVIFFSGRSTLRQFKRELKGEGCSACGGSCSGSCSGCSACSKAAKSCCTPTEKGK